MSEQIEFFSIVDEGFPFVHGGGKDEEGMGAGRVAANCRRYTTSDFAGSSHSLLTSLLPPVLLSGCLLTSTLCCRCEKRRLHVRSDSLLLMIIEALFNHVVAHSSPPATHHATETFPLLFWLY